MHSFVVSLTLAAGCTVSESTAPLEIESPASGLDAGHAPRTPALDAATDAASSAADGRVVDATVSAADASAADAGVRADAALADNDYLGLAAPKHGFRIKTRGREIPPQSDLEFCEVAEIPGTPGEEYLVGTVEAANGKASHHLIVSVATPGSPADKKLRTVELGTQVPCVAAAIEFGEGLTGLAGSQSSLAKAVYPEGIALRVRGGQRVVFDYHYFNYGSAPVLAKSALAVHTVERAAVRNIAGTFAFTNMTLDTPPSAKGTFTAACRFKHDALLAAFGRHTHTRGTDFTVWYDGGPKDGQQIWKSLDWEHDTGFVFETPTLIKAGEGFKFACSFTNDQTKPLRFGIRASDEMCILSGAIWSPTPGMEATDESCVTTWIDEQGIAHDARDNGGFPKAKPDDALSCHLNAFGFSLLSACVGCICDSCGTVMARCNADADCKAILDCRSSCQGDGCDEKCEQVMFDHSTATGMVTQVGECIAKGCGVDCAIAPSVPGTSG